MSDGFVRFFRASAPYIHAHRGKTFVIGVGGEALSEPHVGPILEDVALLQSLGVRVVLAHGARPQIDRRLKKARVKTPLVGERRVTSARALEHVKEAVGSLRVSIEARLSMGLPNTPMAGARIRVATGNLVVAQPVGVVDGVDHLFTGDVRRVDALAIRARLDSGAVVLLSPLGYSLTGDAFNVPYQDVALAAAKALQADKLVLLTEGPPVANRDNQRLTEVSLDEARGLLGRKRLRRDLRAHLERAVDALSGGVGRAHLIPRRVDGGLLRELFTREGAGTMVALGWDEVRRATLNDVGGILGLIQPLADAGLLVERPRALLEREVDRFGVIVRDGMVVACGALLTYDEADVAEIGALAVHPGYRTGGRGEALVAFLEEWARAEGRARVVALTTRAIQWFMERGFREGRVQDLPAARRAQWTKKRNSKVLVKDVTETR